MKIHTSFQRKSALPLASAFRIPGYPRTLDRAFQGFETSSLAKGHWRIDLINSVGEPQFSFKRLQVTKNQLALVKHFETIIIAGGFFPPPGALAVVEVDGQRKLVGAAGALQS